MDLGCCQVNHPNQAKEDRTTGIVEAHCDILAAIFDNVQVVGTKGHNL